MPLHQLLLVGFLYGRARTVLTVVKTVKPLIKLFYKSRKIQMTGMLINGTIAKEVYDDKLIEIIRKLHNLTEKKLLFRRDYR